MTTYWVGIQILPHEDGYDELIKLGFKPKKSGYGLIQETDDKEATLKMALKIVNKTWIITGAYSVCKKCGTRYNLKYDKCKKCGSKLE